MSKYIHNVDKDNYLNGNRCMTIPTFSTFSQQIHTYLLESKLPFFIATDF